jgi:hypothetical protein
MKKQSTMTAKDFEQRFDEGEDITPYIERASIRRPGLEARDVNVECLTRHQSAEARYGRHAKDREPADPRHR